MGTRDKSKFLMFKGLERDDCDGYAHVYIDV